MMTDHPITPPPELVQQWLGTYFGTTVTGEVSDVELVIATQAARWGADQELEACCEWLRCQNLVTHCALIPSLRAARRPKPPSLKEQALELLPEIKSEDVLHLCPLQVAKIRRALEALTND